MPASLFYPVLDTQEIHKVPVSWSGSVRPCPRRRFISPRRCPVWQRAMQVSIVLAVAWLVSSGPKVSSEVLAVSLPSLDVEGAALDVSFEVEDALVPKRSVVLPVMPIASPVHPKPSRASLSSSSRLRAAAPVRAHAMPSAPRQSAGKVVNQSQSRSTDTFAPFAPSAGFNPFDPG